MLCYQPEFLRLVPCYQHLSTMSKVKSSRVKEVRCFFAKKTPTEISTKRSRLHGLHKVKMCALEICLSSEVPCSFLLSNCSVTVSPDLAAGDQEVMQLSRNDLRRSLCACRATSCDTVKRALCAFVQHKGKVIQRKSQKRTPKGFSKAFELFVVSENFETTRVREKNELSGEKKPSCFFEILITRATASRPRVTERKLQASPGGSCASATAVCPGIFSPSAGKSLEASGAEVADVFCLVEHPKTSKNTSKNTSKCILIYRMNSFHVCFASFLDLSLCWFLVGFSEKGLTLPQRFWESRIIQHSKILGLRLISCCQLWNSKSSGLRL